MENQIDFTDFLVESSNPERLHDMLQELPLLRAFILGRGTPSGIIYRDGYPIVRVFGSTALFKRAVETQGYCKIIRQL